ncbi:hypothetical protein PoB_006630800 [Plakobranchus ocellatus]|uniref:Uncharacterized protein n=1 Tax=Plakobranchus ocellatus TaxID=259542 RepID=A0AAV4D6W6_9GAST|nr:hypothetical protein PoB_006630800 [Plakobranchus ocellatus]
MKRWIVNPWAFIKNVDGHVWPCKPNTAEMSCLVFGCLLILVCSPGQHAWEISRIGYLHHGQTNLDTSHHVTLIMTSSRGKPECDFDSVTSRDLTVVRS